MKRQPKDAIAAKLRHAQLTLVEKVLVEFIEAVLGRVPSEDEILASSVHLTFAPSELTVYEHEGKRFSQFWCWLGANATEVVALGFLDTNDLLTLYTARVPEHNWPWAVKAAIEQWKARLAGQRNGET